MLSESHSFPYSDRDIELVCSSLVTIRNETLQVIHLTVKQFPRSRPSLETKGSTYSDLLINPREASIRLTPVCLKYIAMKCTGPLVGLSSGTNRIGRYEHRAIHTRTVHRVCDVMLAASCDRLQGREVLENRQSISKYI